MRPSLRRRSGTRPALVALKALSTILPYRKTPGGREALDAEYDRGTWDYLWGPSELARFSVVVGLCHEIAPSGRLLEIGCGEGILRARLDAARFSRFVGVDISMTAIERARGRHSDPATTFFCADAEQFVPAESFDVIVFNESLEYFDDPVALVRRYRQHLSPGGSFVVSLFAGTHTTRTRTIWRRLEAAHPPTGSTRVTNHDGFTWVIKTFRPDGAAARPG